MRHGAVVNVNETPGQRRRILRWAYLRIFLGGLQMGGAMATFGLICATGITTATLWTVAGTGCVTLVSVALFRWPGYARNG